MALAYILICSSIVMMLVGVVDNRKSPKSNHIAEYAAYCNTDEQEELNNTTLMLTLNNNFGGHNQ